MKVLDDVWDRVKKRLDDSAVFLAVLLILGALGASRGRGAITDVVKEEIAPVQRQANENTQKLVHQADDVHELGKDVRELYMSQRTGRRSERLEAPFPDHDGGEP